MILQMMQVGPLGTNCYIVGDEKMRKVMVIDPGGNAQQILGTVANLRVEVVAIVLTHAHFDHVMGVEALKRATGAPLLAGEKERPVLESVETQAQTFGIAVPPLPPPERWLRDGDKIEVGALQFHVLETPGHTPGGICLYQPENAVVFVGDTLMRGSIGRTDFPGGSLEQILRSIRTKLYALPDATVVYSGHGPLTTIGEEKRMNPFTRNWV